jgi:cell division protein FtsI/penicillin-binding protein 2
VPTRSYGKRAAALLAVLVAIVAVAAFLLLRGHDDGAARSKAAVDAFALAWTAGDDAGAGSMTDDAGKAIAALKANRAGLDGAKVKVAPGLLTVADGRATGRLRVAWTIPGIGAYAYASPVTVVKDAKGVWAVHYSPRLIHPRLTSKTRLGTSADTPRRASILDREGDPLIQERSVVRVGLEHDKVTADSAAKLATALGLAEAPLAKALDSAGPRQFVEAETLRPGDYAQVKAKLRGIRGLLAVQGTAELAPSREFGRALLGAVGLTPGDETGQWGLEKAFDKQLAGTATRRIVIRETAGGTAVRTLVKEPGRAPRALRTTLSVPTQTAAEQALNGVRGNAALVALQPSSGDILAVANRPVADTFDKALAGSYAPGSTFKVITTEALLEHDFDPGSNVPCPQTLVVDGKTFKNFEGEEAGQASFADDFAISCNTAFVSLAGRLAPDALHKTAQEFGLGKTLDLPLTTAAASVPPGTDAVSEAASMIGQAKITATPLTMAGVAAAVANGRWRAPRLLATDPIDTGPSPAHLDTLRSLMRQVVTRGTAATAFAGVPGEVRGKTGTAEFGSADPPQTHAWFIAYRGDVAIAVLVEKGSSGGAVAAPIAARFFEALGGG